MKIYRFYIVFSSLIAASSITACTNYDSITTGKPKQGSVITESEDSNRQRGGSGSDGTENIGQPGSAEIPSREEAESQKLGDQTSSHRHKEYIGQEAGRVENYPNSIEAEDPGPADQSGMGDKNLDESGRQKSSSEIRKGQQGRGGSSAPLIPEEPK